MRPRRILKRRPSYWQKKQVNNDSTISLSKPQCGSCDEKKHSMNTTLSVGIFALFFGFTGAVLMAEEKPEAILAAAKKSSENQPWRVEAHIVAEKIDMYFCWIINGKEFDLTIGRYYDVVAKSM